MHPLKNTLRLADRETPRAVQKKVGKRLANLEGRTKITNKAQVGHEQETIREIPVNDHHQTSSWNSQCHCLRRCRPAVGAGTASASQPSWATVAKVVTTDAFAGGQ